MIRDFLPVTMFMLFFAASTNAAESDSAVRERIASRFPSVTAENVSPSPVAGLYEVVVGPIVVYASADGRYMLRGEIHDMKTERNLTETRVQQGRAETLADLGDEELIVFGKADAPHTVTVFTDISCGYCRVLHSQIEEYNRRGITVRYAAYPRNGLASEVWQQMEKVWCADDRKKALTMAKLDRDFEAKACTADQVTEQWQLGRMLGVRGTPAMFTTSGHMFPGYLPPGELVKRLQALGSENDSER